VNPFQAYQGVPVDQDLRLFQKRHPPQAFRQFRGAVLFQGNNFHVLNKSCEVFRNLNICGSAGLPASPQISG
jgi:hypothetical protein